MIMVIIIRTGIKNYKIMLSLLALWEIHIASGSNNVGPVGCSWGRGRTYTALKISNLSSARQCLPSLGDNLIAFLSGAAYRCGVYW